MAWGNVIIAALVSPALFYAGVAAVSVPIVIHLLSKQRFKRVRWAATDFLLTAQRMNRQRVRIEELILLALRCLIIVLAGLMLARWFVWPEGWAATLGSVGRTCRIVVLDDSYSMWATDGASREAAQQDTDLALDSVSTTTSQATTRFNQAKSVWWRLIERLQAESPNDSLTVLLSSQPDRPFCVEDHIGELDQKTFKERLEGARASYRGGNMPAAMASVRQRLDEYESILSAAVYVISDFQQIDWIADENVSSADAQNVSLGENVTGGPNRTNPLAALSSWAPNERLLRVTLIDVGVSGAENLSMTSIEAENPQAVAGVGGRYTARVTHFGSIESQPTSMQVYVGDAAQPPTIVPALSPGQTVNIPIEITFPDEGSETLTVELEPDLLPIDNTRTKVVPVQRALRILVVNGESSTDPYEDEVFLLTVALRPEGFEFSGNEVTVVDSDELQGAELSGFHIVILANVPELTEETVQQLEAYVTAGGGLMFFLGDQVDADFYNETLYHDGNGLLPTKLGEVITFSVEQPGVPFGVPLANHPVMRRFADTQVAYFADARAWQYFICEPDDNPTALRNRISSTAPADDRGPLTVLLRFEDADRHPAIIERILGQGRIVLVTTTADKEWNNLADYPAYVVLMMELMQYLAQRPADVFAQLVGEPILFALDPAQYQLAATLQLPTFPVEPAIHIDAQPDAATGLPTIHWPDTWHPGIYRFELTTRSGRHTVKQIAANVDPTESDLRHASPADLTKPIPNLAIEYATEKTIASQQDKDNRYELWPVLWVVLVVVLMLEQIMAAWFGSHRRLASFLRGVGK